MPGHGCHLLCIHQMVLLAKAKITVSPAAASSNGSSRWLRGPRSGPVEDCAGFSAWTVADERPGADDNGPGSADEDAFGGLLAVSAAAAAADGPVDRTAGADAWP